MDQDDDARLPTHLWLDGHLRQLTSDGVFYTIVHKGDAARGTVALKLNLGRENGCRLLIQARSPEGELGWLAALDGKTTPETEADAYLQRQLDRDPDLWVIEIESKDGRHPFTGKIL